MGTDGFTLGPGWLIFQARLSLNFSLGLSTADYADDMDEEFWGTARSV